ncbi:MAG TPA: hypothetical protein PLN52_23050 [Opitutaceae bacterium]|nr:hypothetical protein [Opitutaceae bacterium]
MASETALPTADVPVAKVDVNPSRRYVLLPDNRFFVRTISVTPGATATEVASQVELALETLSPFPLAQLFHGHFWRAGQSHALIFAAFKRRFTAEEMEEWAEADLVIPSFVSAIAWGPAPGTTVILSEETYLTAVHWGESSSIPTKVVTETLPPEADEASRNRVRDELVRALGGSVRLVELGLPLSLVRGGSEDDRDFEFAVDQETARLDAGEFDAVDVRDKEELLARRKSKARDLLYWRLGLGLLTLLLLAALTEGALVATKYWQQTRRELVARQLPEVEKVMNNQAVTRRIEQFSESLKPFEMISVVENKPESIYFLSTEARENVLTIEAITRVASEVPAYEAALRAHPSLASVELSRQGERDGVTTFTLTVTFRPEALRKGGAQP